MAGQYSQRRRGTVPGYLLLVLLLLVLPGRAQAETVKLPMSFDFALLRALIVQQAYHDPGERAKVVAMSEGCNEIWLDNPQLQEDKGYVRFQTGVGIVWGTPVGDSCFAPVSWSGTIILWQQPLVDEKWQLHLKTVNSVLLDQTGKQAALSGLVWDLVKKNAHTYIDSIAINLAPPVDNLKQFMAPSEENGPSATAAGFLASMRPEQPRVSSEGLALNILAEADIPRDGQEEFFVLESPELAMQMMALWQSWDALLVNMINQLSPMELTEEDRQLLFDTLLTVRYEFSEVVGTPNLTTGFIRGQFISSWIALKPVFQRHLTPRPADSILGYLSFFTAADALVTLDRLGPLIGIELSREGFYRLAHMLSDTPLNEGGAVDRQLRDLLGLGAPMAVPPPEPPLEPPSALPALPVPPDQPLAPPAPQAFPEEPGFDPQLDDSGQFRYQQPETPPETTPDTPPDGGASLWRWWGRLFSPMTAQAASAPQVEEVTSWTAELTPAKTLLPRIYTVLAKVAASQKNRLDNAVQAEGWGEQMVMATAWHESCFRQFIVKDRKITYLLSYNNSSVGIMQVNEKVWRGIYDLQELRWNIEYNSRAGTEILALYLNRYLAKQKKLSSFDDADGRRYLAGWLYALYNGGPAQLKKFPARASSGRLNRIDKQFQDKYDQVAAELWLETVDCLPSA